jgi:hypothetical protein
MFNQITASATVATLDAWRRSENSKQASHAAEWVDEDAVKNGDPGDALSGTRKYEPPESHLSFFAFYRSTEVPLYLHSVPFLGLCLLLQPREAKQQQPGAGIGRKQTHSLRQRYWNDFLIFLVRIHSAIVPGTVASFTSAWNGEPVNSESTGSVLAVSLDDWAQTSLPLSFDDNTYCSHTRAPIDMTRT